MITHLRNEKGSVLIYTVSLSVVFVCFFYLIAIVGHVKVVEHLAYKAADASALAGASQFSYISSIPDDPWKWGESTTYKAVIDPELAKQRAEELFNDNKGVLEALTTQVIPTYTKIADDEYQVEVKIKLKPLYSAEEVSKIITVKSQVAAIKSEEGGP